MAETDHPFKTKSWKEDLALVVEEEKLYVSKTVLALVSPVFEKMFAGNFKESDLEVIELPGKKFDGFVEFLCWIYPNVRKEVTASNVFQLLPLAHEYQTEQLLKRCVEFLKQKIDERSGSKIFKHLAAARMFELNDLEHTCIELASLQTCGNIITWKQTHSISDDIVIKILLKAFDKSEKKNVSYTKEISYLKRNHEDEIRSIKSSHQRELNRYK